MQTELAPPYRGTPDGEEAEAILRKCVHCGFCTATCPTYQLLGDELDGPRGRIYLIKQVLEGHAPTRATQQHLDRCLTCRNCESTCPSGVQYGHLVDIGRRIVDAQVPRRAGDRAARWALKRGLTSRAFGPALRAGQAVRGLLPAALRAKVPVREGSASAAAASLPPRTRAHARRVLLLEGCVQPALLPGINAATVQVLDACGIDTLTAPAARCCGAVAFHLNDQEEGLERMREAIAAWWPHVEAGDVEAIVTNASGCGATVKDYGHLLRHDPDWAEKAARVSALARDLSELLPALLPTLRERVAQHLPDAARVLAYHPPCTLQHGQKLRGGVEGALRQLGFDVRLPLNESHLCCGSAGTYSVLQPEIAYPLRDRKLGHLQQLQPAAILSANVGCIAHLQSGTALPVRHWVEVVAEAIDG